MRQVERKCGQAFFGNGTRKIGNDEVSVGAWFLHGNKIAERITDGIVLSDCGWRTTTTKSRLNAILRLAGTNYRIYQKSHQWFIWDAATGKSEPWDGDYLIPAAA